MDTKLKILVAAGGTGGHLFPAIAVVKELERLTNSNITAEFIGSQERMESEIVPKLGYKFHPIPIIGYYGLFSLKTMKNGVRSSAVVNVGLD